MNIYTWHGQTKSKCTGDDGDNADGDDRINYKNIRAGIMLNVFYYFDFLKVAE